MEIFRAVSGQWREIETNGQGGLWALELWTQTGKTLQEHGWGEPTFWLRSYFQSPG